MGFIDFIQVLTATHALHTACVTLTGSWEKFGFEYGILLLLNLFIGLITKAAHDLPLTRSVTPRPCLFNSIEVIYSITGRRRVCSSDSSSSMSLLHSLPKVQKTASSHWGVSLQSESRVLECVVLLLSSTFSATQIILKLLIIDTRLP